MTNPTWHLLSNCTWCLPLTSSQVDVAPQRPYGCLCTRHLWAGTSIQYPVLNAPVVTNRGVEVIQRNALCSYIFFNKFSMLLLQGRTHNLYMFGLSPQHAVVYSNVHYCCYVISAGNSTLAAISGFIVYTESQQCLCSRHVVSSSKCRPAVCKPVDSRHGSVFQHLLTNSHMIDSYHDRITRKCYGE